MSEINKVLFIGSKPLGLRCLQKLYELRPTALIGVMTFDDREDQRNAFDDICRFAVDNKIPVRIAKNRKDSENIIAEIKPEICFVNGWYWLIGNETLNLVPRGFLGLHNSLLPKYRGGSPLVWTMINGEEYAGYSIFSFTEGMDEGDIWAQDSVEIGIDDYISDMLAKLEEKSICRLDNIYPKILDGSLKPTPQNHSMATYCAMRTADDGRIDWNWPAKRVYDFIRAQSEPYPGAFTFTDDKKVIIWRARLLDMTYYGTPGQAARVAPDGVLVICGDSHPLLITEAELENGKESAHKVIKSIKTRFR
jgi:methionyl-tRNA formyltransferase